MPLPTAPRNSPFGPVTLRAITVVQAPVMRLCTGSTSSSGDRGSVLKALKYGRSATLTGGTGQTEEPLISSVRIENVDAADIRQCAQLGFEHQMDILAGHPTLVILARGDPARSHIRNEVLLNDLEVFELLIEMTGQQQHGIFQLAFA